MTPAQQIKMGTDLMQRGELDKARHIAEQTVKAHPRSSAAFALLGEIVFRKKQIPEAIRYIDQAVELGPNNVNRVIQKARCYVVFGDIGIAKAAVQRALELQPDSPDQFLLLAAVLVRCDAHGEALAIYQRVKEQHPKNVDARRGLATAFRILGQAQEAEVECDWVLNEHPDDYEIIYLRSSLRKQSEDHNHVDELVSRLKCGAKDWRGTVQIAYSLAKELEDLSEYSESFKYLQQGATLRRRHTRYDVQNDIKIFDTISKTFTPRLISEKEASGYSSDAPIFVLGLPRTGSTLVERVISSHSDVHMAGELNDFALELVKLTTQANNGKSVPRLELPQAAAALDMAQLGRNYIDSTKDSAGSTKHFIDKLPLNFLYIGFIHLALPNAKIVHIKRNPMDACYAIYKYLFKQAYPFSYDLEELAAYYIAYHRLMEYWRKLLPGVIYDIRYEDLVANQESESRRLLKYLGLEWQDACLNFHLNQQASATGSASQVREPLYSSSVGKWCHYEEELDSLAVTLKNEGVEIT